jgi:capsular exopolysaccharide synthesis family protein
LYGTARTGHRPPARPAAGVILVASGLGGYDAVMNATELFRTVLRRKLVASVTLLTVVAAGLLFLVGQPRVYESTASVALLPSEQEGALGAYDAVVDRLLPLYASQVRSQTFLDRVAGRLPDRLTGSQLLGQVFAKPNPGAAVLQIVARAGNPHLATRIAQAVTAELLSTLRNTKVVTFDVIDSPRVPDQPVTPGPRLVLAASLLLGLFLALAAAAAWERLFGRIRDLNELRAAAAGRRILGVLPYQRQLQRSPASLFVGDATMVETEENLRAIRTVLVGPGWSRPALSKVAVTSLNPGDGKSTFVANLAVVVAEVGVNVLVVDAHVRHPSQHDIFALPNDVGLSSAVRFDEDVTATAQPSRFPKVSVITAGPPLDRRNEIVNLYVNAIPKLEGMADLVVIDSASMSSDADVGLLTAMTDGVVLLVRSGATSREELRHALEELEAVGVQVLGLVLTMGSRRRLRQRRRQPKAEAAAAPRPGLRAWIRPRPFGR